MELYQFGKYVQIHIVVDLIRKEWTVGVGAFSVSTPKTEPQIFFFSFMFNAFVFLSLIFTCVTCFHAALLFWGVKHHFPLWSISSLFVGFVLFMEFS